MKYEKTIYLCEEKLPRDNTYVVAHYNGGNWKDSGDQQGCEWKVLKFKRCQKTENNVLGYEWKEFGPGTWDGHYVDMWFELPR